MSVLTKVDIRAIWLNHLDTLHDGDGHRSWSDIGLFFGVPAVVALGLWWFGVGLTNEATNILTNALAIFAGLLFNLLVVLQSVSWSDTHPLRKTLKGLATETYNNIAHAIVVSLLTLVFLVVASNYPQGSEGRLWLSAWIACLVLHFALTLFMVLKRMHAMLQQDFARRN